MTVQFVREIDNDLATAYEAKLQKMQAEANRTIVIDDPKFAQWAKDRLKECPHCSVRIEKNEGCDHMKTATTCQNPGCNQLHRSESGFCHLHRSLADGVRRVVYQGQRPPRLPWPENTQALWQISENAGTGYSSAAMESPSKKNESRHASAHRRSIFQQLTARMKNARLKAQSKKNDASLRKQEGGRLQERIDRALEGKRLHRSLKQ
jgi:hypothetical protein